MDVIEFCFSFSKKHMLREMKVVKKKERNLYDLALRSSYILFSSIICNGYPIKLCILWFILSLRI